MEDFISKNRTLELNAGTIENPIIDCDLSLDQALRRNPNFILPGIDEIYEKQVLLTIKYLSFDGKYHQGQIIIDRDLEKDVLDLFDFLIEQNFPIGKMIPVTSEIFDFNDDKSMAENNSSGFNPRFIAGTDRPSNHAYGRAIDINPAQNPFIKNGKTEPAGAEYNLEKSGTITPLIVEFLKERGWRWGGDYENLKDYHHFDKLFNEITK